HRARRPGPDAQCAAAVDPRDAAAPGAHLGQVDDRDLDREAGAGTGAAEAAFAADLEVVGDLRPPLADDARLGRRATHVEGDDLVGIEQAPADPGGDRTCRAP